MTTLIDKVMGVAGARAGLCISKLGTIFCYVLNINDIYWLSKKESPKVWQIFPEIFSFPTYKYLVYGTSSATPFTPTTR